MSTFKIMVGYPRSGKNTWVKENNKDSIVVEPDWIRTNIMGHQFHQSLEGIVWFVTESYLKMLLSQDQNVILNEINLSKSIREKYIKMAIEFNKDIQIECIWIKTPIHVCLRRNEFSKKGDQLPRDVLESMEPLLEEPTLEEGFYSILEVD